MARTAKVQILDGDATGCYECILPYWTGAAFKIPRKLLRENHKDRDRKKLEKACTPLKGGGIYFLFGRIEREGKWKKCVYVGKGDYYEDNRKEETGVLRRVLQRHRGSIDKDWEEVVVIVSEDKDRHPLSIDALERMFIERVSKNLDTAEYVLLNETIPRLVINPDEDLYRFIDYTNIALLAFGYRVLESGKTVDAPVLLPEPPEPLPRHPKPPTPDEKLLSLAYTPKALGKTFKASGKYINDKKFILLKGSEICPTEIPSCSDTIKKMRKKHAHKIDKNGVLTEDITFGSSTTAAELVCGSAMDGYRKWHNAKGVKLGKLLKG